MENVENGGRGIDRFDGIGQKNRGNREMKKGGHIGFQ
jgi:hypothetical protein